MEQPLGTGPEANPDPQLVQQLNELRFFGFTVLEDVLPADTVRALHDFVMATEPDIGVDTLYRGRARHLANLVTLDPMFFPLIDHPRVLSVIEGTMGSEIILGSLNARVVYPGDPDQGLHSDVPVPLLRHGEAPLMMNTIWALQDFTAANGATRVVPGSHNSGLRVPPSDFHIPFVHKAEIRAGSVIVINGQTWHGSGENRSDTPRAALFGHYRFAHWLRFQCDPHDRFDPAWLPMLSDRQKTLMRMIDGLTGQHGADFYER